LSPTEKMCVGLVTNTQHQFIRDMALLSLKNDTAKSKN